MPFNISSLLPSKAKAEEGAGERIGKRVGDGAVVLVAQVVRRHIAVTVKVERIDEGFDPISLYAPGIGVHDQAHLAAQRLGCLKDGFSELPLPGTPL